MEANRVEGVVRLKRNRERVTRGPVFLGTAILDRKRYWLSLWPRVKGSMRYMRGFAEEKRGQVRGDFVVLPPQTDQERAEFWGDGYITIGSDRYRATLVPAPSEDIYVASELEVL